jgi:hypothetical protein
MDLLDSVAPVVLEWCELVDESQQVCRMLYCNLERQRVALFEQANVYIQKCNSTHEQRNGTQTPTRCGRLTRNNQRLQKVKPKSHAVALLPSI